MKSKKIANWDLSDIYKSINDKKIQEDIARVKKEAISFEKKYKGKMSNISVNEDFFLKAISKYEEILKNAQKPYIFVNLMFTVDSNNAKIASIMQKMEEEYIETTRHLLFFELEFTNAKNIKKIINAKKLGKYSHFISHIYKNKKHNLSEKEELILQDMTLVGKSAFTRLFDQIQTRKKFDIVLNKKKYKLNETEIISLLYDKKRSTRKLAAKSLSEGLSDNIFYITFIYNTLLNDAKITDNLRGYNHPEESRYIEEETEKEVVDLLSSLVSKKYKLVSRYYKLKKKALKLDKLYDYDRYAPLTTKSENIPFNDAKDIVLESFSEFSESLASIAKEFFDKKWIDAEPKDGKRGGAFCAYVTPDIHPYVMMNYKGTKRDVMTLAHELGHGAHAVLAKDKGFLSFSSSLALAETASVFGEMLVFNKALQKTKTEKDKFLLLSGKLEDIFATVFRQNCMHEFEQEVHKHRREKGELMERDFNEIWHKKNKKMFGDSVELTDGYKLWWSYIPHFMHSSFYVYTYAFGELLTLSLYSMHKKEGASFEKKYLKLLSAGGSESPKKLLKEIGIDITKKEFWQGGLKYIEEMVSDAEKAYSKL